MKRNKFLLRVALFAIGLGHLGTACGYAQSWDVMNETYGNGPGEASFNASYVYSFGTAAPTETLAVGKATLSLDPGVAARYPVKSPNLPAWAGGGADLTIEWKLALKGGASAYLYLSENQKVAASSWGHILSFNRDYSKGYQANEIEDYYTRNGASLAPPGFDSSLPHVYRLVRKSGVNSWYLDGQLLKQALVTGPGAAGDGVLRLEWGLNPNTNSPSSVEVYCFRAANGAFLPGGPIVASPPAPRVLQVGSEKQLFIDDLFFEAATNVTLKLHPARKTGEKNLEREHPWESATLNWFNVLQEGDKYRMWYECYDVDGWPTADDTSFCYAESTDGLHWKRPQLGLFSYKGSTNNNILFRMIGPPTAHSRVHGTGFFVDPTAPAESRYKVVSQGLFDQGYDAPYRIAGMYSADGLRWTRCPKPICMMFADSQYSGFWDERLKKYVIYGRVAGRGRSLGRSESDDFSRFEPLSLVLQTDDRDPPNSDLYNSAALKYPYAANVYLMFISLFQHTPETLDIRLAVSRDGIRWTLPERTPFIPLGKSGEFDSGSLYMGQGMIRKGDELWQYYGGSSLNHKEGELENLIKPGGGRIYSRVVSRVDGFVSADAGPTGGNFVTPPLTFAGNILKLNVAVHAGGSVRVALLDAHGVPLKGYSLEDCLPMTADNVDLLVHWKNGADVSSCAGQPTKMYIEMKDASLYAFRFTVGYAGKERDH
jgi:hypothetical protein